MHSEWLIIAIRLTNSTSSILRCLRLLMPLIMNTPPRCGGALLGFIHTQEF